MIPIGTNLPTRRAPWMTYAIILLTLAVWVVVQGAGEDPVLLATTVCNFGMVPGELTHLAPLGQMVPLGYGMGCAVDHNAINLLTPLFSIFLHGSWMHILGNMLFLWVFGRDIEDTMGHFSYLGFYLLCGVVAGIGPDRLSSGIAGADGGRIRSNFRDNGGLPPALSQCPCEDVLLHYPRKHPGMDRPHILVSTSAV